MELRTHQLLIKSFLVAVASFLQSECLLLLAVFGCSGGSSVEHCLDLNLTFVVDLTHWEDIPWRGDGWKIPSE